MPNITYTTIDDKTYSNTYNIFLTKLHKHTRFNPSPLSMLVYHNIMQLQKRNVQCRQEYLCNLTLKRGERGEMYYSQEKCPKKCPINRGPKERRPHIVQFQSSRALQAKYNNPTPHRLSFKQPRQSNFKKKYPPTTPIEAIRIWKIYIYIIMILL